MTRFIESRRLRLGLLAAGLSLLPGVAGNAASLDQQADDLFNGMVNTTAPQAFKGQTMNTYTAGSLFVRVPDKTFQLASFQAPYIRMGNSCGSIDAFGGSFSHISSAQFKEALKSITSAIPGMLFQMTIEAVEPLLGSNMKWFKDIEKFVNQFNISRCEASKIALYEANQLFGMTKADVCKTVAPLLGKADDVASGRIKCDTAAGVKDVMESAKASGDPAIKQQIPFHGNLVWAALKRMSHLDDDDRELVMAITGTTIYPDTYEENTPEPAALAPSGLSTELLLRGNGSLSPAGLSWVPMWSCGSDMAECRAPASVQREMRPMNDRVANIMAGLAAKIKDGTRPPSVREIGFVNNVPVAVYRMLAAGGAVDNPAVSEALRASYNDYIAIEFVHGLLARATRDALNIELLDGHMLPKQRARLSVHIGFARDFMNRLNADRAVAAQKAQTAATIMTQVAELERNLRASMPQQIRDLLAYSALGAGG